MNQQINYDSPSKKTSIDQVALLWSLERMKRKKEKLNNDVEGTKQRTIETRNTQLRPVVTKKLPNSVCVGHSTEQEKSARKMLSVRLIGNVIAV